MTDSKTVQATAMKHTDTDLRKQASQHGALRTQLLGKMKRADLTSEERLQLLSVTLDYADIKLSQGQRASAEEVFDSSVALGASFAADGEPVLRLLLRLPESHLSKVMQKITEKEVAIDLFQMVADSKKRRLIKTFNRSLNELVTVSIDPLHNY